MKKENFTPQGCTEDVANTNSVPDSQVPQSILDQYAKVNKVKKKDEKQDSTTDSGVSSETENLDDEKGRIKKLMTQFEKKSEVTPNLESMDQLSASSETMKLERKNPHLKLTDTLKKALKQPLPAGPPPKKPPRVFATITENVETPKKDPKKMLEKLEQVYEQRKADQSKNIKTASPKKPREVHYLCTEILDIAQRTLPPIHPSDPLSRCFKSLNCSFTNSTSSLPYTRLSTHNEFDPCNCNSNNELSTFLTEKCSKCQSNDNTDSFKCHLKCECSDKKSEFFVDKEHVYNEPYNGDTRTECERRSHYGTLNTLKTSSRSLEELRPIKKEEDEVIYDVPAEETRPDSPASTKSDFLKLRENFENPSQPMRETDALKPILKLSRSTENIEDSLKKNMTRKFWTETKRTRNRCEVLTRESPPKSYNQLHVDKENLNRLMNEIYETVTAACNMDENRPGCFPTENSDGSTSEESVKITRNLTEKRKNYVRRVSSRVAYLDKKPITQKYRHQTSVCSYKPDAPENQYSTFRSWKSFRASQTNLPKLRMDSLDSKCNLTDSCGNLLTGDLDGLSIDEKAGCLDIELPFEPREKGLFNVCLLVGMNYMTGQAYVKSVFPKQVQVPPHIENLIFPETLSTDSKSEWSANATDTQCYSLVLTDERGERSYGYCRRVLPEGGTSCLPLCYCLIGKYRAPGFYYKVLKEIESHHGSCETNINFVLQKLFEMDFPEPGQGVPVPHRPRTVPDYRQCKSELTCESANSASVNSASDSAKCNDYDVPEYSDLQNNNGPKEVLLDLCSPGSKVIKRPIVPRVDEDCLSKMLDLLGSGLAIKVFGSLLLERKVIIVGDKLSDISSCLEALQLSLYPMVWQQPLISTVPGEIQHEAMDAPLPMLAGMLKTQDLDTSGVGFEEGMLIDLTHPSKLRFYQGDESTILPTSSYKTLKTSLQMESTKNKDKQEDTKTRNVMISEAFMRFFVEILDGYWRHLRVGVVGEADLGNDGVLFDKESFIKSATTKQNHYFLEWFTETAMFNHFIRNMCTRHAAAAGALQDTPLPDYYDQFLDRVTSRSRFATQKIEGKNYRGAVNRKVRLLKNKLKDLIG